MSSSRRVSRGLRGPASWPLRTRLLAEQILLVALVCTAIGAATLLFLQQFLSNQFDAQVRDAANRATYAQQHFDHPDQGHPEHPDDVNGLGQPPGPGPQFLSNAPGLMTGTVGVLLRTDGDEQAGIFQAAGHPGEYTNSPATAAIPQSATDALVSVSPDGRTHAVDLPQLGDYLVMSTSQAGDLIVVGMPLKPVNDTLTGVGWVFGSVAGAGVLMVGVLGALIIRHTLRPLRRVAATAGRVAELPLDRGEVALSVRVPDVDTDPRTEVGQVGAALNRMLGHIANALAARQASETRVRQFVADASHELRTPLAAIRGYAELARRSSDPVPPDVAHALRRVESESDRMTTLVEDLLLLARLDSGRPLEREPVDLSRLVMECVGDARVAGPDHHWRLELPAEPVMVPGDAPRLHQVLANLLANGRTHTPPGSTVTTSVAVADGDSGRHSDRDSGPDSGRSEVVLSVVDDGPGIPPDLLPQVFDRFARGDSSRSRAVGSTGLGLSIVSAVVSAHQGSVTVESRPGRTAFVVRLPHSAGTGSAQPSRSSPRQGERHDRARP